MLNNLVKKSKTPGISATMVLDSRAPSGARLSTIELEAPRFILAEINTHKMLSRGSASSRAVPTSKMLTRVETEPAEPAYWGKNQPGMVADVEMQGEELAQAKRVWAQLREQAIAGVRTLANLGLHKQLANRPVEPWMRHRMITTATEWRPILALREHPHAQPEFRELAMCIRELLEDSTPRELEELEPHAPYVTGYDEDKVKDLSLKRGLPRLVEMVSIARCARVSYLNHDGVQDIEADIPRYDKLLESGHMGPMEHVAYALTSESWRRIATAAAQEWVERRVPVGNFWGWLQYRKVLDHEHDIAMTWGRKA